MLKITRRATNRRHQDRPIPNNYCILQLSRPVKNIPHCYKLIWEDGGEPLLLLYLALTIQPSAVTNIVMVVGEVGGGGGQLLRLWLAHCYYTITRCYYLHAVTTVLPRAVTNIVLVVGEVGVDDHILDDHVLLAPRHIIPIIPDYRLLAFWASIL